MRRRSHWGWGFEDERPSAADLSAAAAGLAAHLGFGSPEPEQAVVLEAIELPPARVALPPRLPVTQDTYARALHAQGRSYLDLVRGFRGHFAHPPDAVALPRDDEELDAVLAWAAEADLAVVPVGGGTSVVGGIDARPGTHAGVLSLSLRAMNRVLEVDGLQPANCRLIDAREAALTLAGDGSSALLVLGFESAGTPLDERFARTAALCRAHGGEVSERGGGSSAWRDAFLRAPYLRDTLVAMGVLSETFESAVTWDRLDAFVAQVLGATRDALGPAGLVTVRLTHAYPDGAAPYFTVVAPARRGEEEEQWHAVKRAASDAILAAGGTITHHHAVGRDHRAWYDRQRPDPFAAALRAAKAALDPDTRLNPGVLLD